ncbi:hypothetical protein [Aquamicrobium defluvii]|uniref:Uncharacterized protein n=1 Tax=Aquamicrobium defluvii TaxID=69279 RepID=A0A4R6XZZ9_9HYPH|nr:hypothetical protein [Aquamicrobium defluvii]TDR27767.1 hypothetical protein DES43_1664 [Aquamicrobium defluvii]
MTTANVKYQVEMAAVDKDLAKAVNDARNALASAEKAMIEAYTKSPRYQAMLDLAGYGGGGYGKVPTYPVIQGPRIVCKVMLDLEQEPTRPQLYLDPKTANLLLSGKLLSDDEKRHLLKDMGVELPKSESAT